MGKRSHANRLMQRIDESIKYKELIMQYPDKFNLGDKTQKQWVELYDEEINKNIRELEKLRHPNATPRLILLAILGAVFFALFMITPQVTTLTIHNPEKIFFAINETVSTESYLLITSEQQEVQIPLKHFNLPSVNNKYQIGTLPIAIEEIPLEKGSNQIIIQLIDKGEVKEIIGYNIVKEASGES